MQEQPSVNVLTHATTSPLQMTRTTRLASRLRVVANLNDIDDVLRIVLKIQHNDQFRPTSNQTIMVSLGVPKSVLTQKCGDVINTQQAG